MSHTFTVVTFRLTGWTSDDKDFAQCTVYYEVDGDKFLSTAVGDEGAAAVANVCQKIAERRNIPMSTVVAVVLPVALEALDVDQVLPFKGYFD